MLLDKLLFNIKHWQAFLVAVMVVLLNGYFLKLEPGFKGIIGDFLPGCLFVSWMMLLGMRLKENLPAYYRVHYIIFIVGGFFIVTTLVLLSVYKQELPSFFDANVPILILSVIVYFAIAIAFVGFLARAMKSLQTHDRAPVANYGGDVFLWSAWVIGVWILQPRLNLLYDQYYSSQDAPGY